MQLPEPRGPLTGGLIAALRGGRADAVPAASLAPADPTVDDDLQLALWICYQLHYRGFSDVSEAWEWQPELIALCRRLEAVWLDALRQDVTVPTCTEPVPETLTRLVATESGPPLDRFLQRDATSEQFAEFAVHRSVVHLKEADPYSWAVPRLVGRAKAALVSMQAAEYGALRHGRHADLFRETLRSLDLDDSYGRYVDVLPGVTLAVSNLVTLFGLRRELRGALVGHLAATETNGSVPNRRYSNGLRRLGAHAGARRFFDERASTQARHQLIASELCGALVADEPQLAGDVLFGAAACLHIEGRFAAHLLRSWLDGVTSLRDPGLVAATATAEVG